ncbi:HaaA family cyclophane-containing RiPP peptide [Streptomyces niveus]|uniref:HaaA family cyclophane-containing RiPP peptide n=1 Tax=Streptomyces niveus TaxID=193462 RepID=UPI0035E39755
MLSHTSVPAPHATVPGDPEPTQGPVVLDRVAARVRQRLAAEQTANQTGEGSHAASLIRTWPL